MQPLDGIKVLDLSRVLAGPWCTQTLADLGADVWKIEECARGDDTRTWTTPNIGGKSTYFLCANRSKRSLAIDLKTAEGKAVIRTLAQQADILVENFRKGALERLGLGWEDLHALNKRLIYCSISGYGRTGPRSDEAGYDFAIQAESGLMAITGEADGAPMKLGVAVADIITGMNATQAVLAALIARDKTGRGQHIDMALHDSAVSLLANVGSSYLATGEAPKRYGNAHATVVPYQIFPTRDGVLALACGNDSQFRTLCVKALDLPAFPDDERYKTAGNRAVYRDTLIPALTTAFMKKDTAQWLDLLRDLGVPAGQVRSVPDVLEAEETQARGMIAAVDDPIHGRLRLPASPLRLSDTPVRPPVTPPRLGQHSRVILSQAAGLDPQQIDALIAQGVVVQQDL